MDHLEFYLLNYFKPGHGEPNSIADRGRKVFQQVGCGSCHVSDMTINHDRRVADLETVYDPVRGIFNSMFATATPLYREVDDGSGLPHLKLPLGNSFLVKDILTDFKRHDVGVNFYERNWDGTIQTQFLTRPLWGGLDRALRTRWPQHYIERRDPSPWWRSAGVTRQVCGFGKQWEGRAPDVPEFAGAVSAG